MPSYDKKQIVEVVDSLDDLKPEVDEPCARDVIVAAYDKIMSRVEQGISHKKILKHLQAGGVELSMGTYRQYLRAIKSERESERRKAIAQKAKATRERNRRASEQADAPKRSPIKPQRNPSGITPKLPGVESVAAEIVDE